MVCPPYFNHNYQKIKKMKEETFIRTQYGDTETFYTGQKVRCIYYHESIQHPYMIIGGFTPVKLGIIVGDAGTRPYYLAGSTKSTEAVGTEQYLYVKFKEYFFKKAIPISCMNDAQKEARALENMLKESEHRIGERGYDLESFNALTEQMNRAKLF